MAKITSSKIIILLYLHYMQPVAFLYFFILAQIIILLKFINKHIYTIMRYNINL